MSEQQQQVEAAAAAVAPSSSINHNKNHATRARLVSNLPTIFTFHQPPGQPIRDLTWDNDSHWWAVIFRGTGSVWPRVLHWCATTLLLTYMVYTAKHVYGYDITCNPSGHKYMATLMSFVVVSRVKIVYGQYMEQAADLQQLLETCRNVVQSVVCITAPDQSARAKQWRQDVCLAVLKLLRFTMAVLEFRSIAGHTADLGNLLNLTPQEQEELFLTSPTQSSSSSAAAADSPRYQNEWLQQQQQDKMHSIMEDSITPATIQKEPRTSMERASGAVHILAHAARHELLKQQDGTWINRPAVLLHPCNEELRWLDYIAAYLKAWAGLEKFITTPFPFPMVQMAKSLLVIWLFTLPFALCHDDETSMAEKLVMIFLITMGFVGIESVSAELADVFGDDPNDMDNAGHASVCYETVYIAIYKVDGPEWATQLKDRFVSYCSSKIDGPFRQEQQYVAVSNDMEQQQQPPSSMNNDDEDTRSFLSAIESGMGADADHESFFGATMEEEPEQH